MEQQEKMTMYVGRTIFMIHPYLLLIPIVAISSPAARHLLMTFQHQLLIVIDTN